MLKIAPSILAVWDKTGGDTGEVVLAARTALHAGGDWVHVDVMDGHYVPRMTFGTEMVSALQGVGVLDVHLMVERPENVVESYLQAGADRIVFHPSASDDIGGVLQTIADFGAIGGLALDVDEDVRWLEPWVENIDQTLIKQVLVMTVKTGAGGQAFRGDLLEKVNIVRRLVGPNVSVAVDGGVNGQNVRQCVAAGADCVVAGNAIFNAPDMAAAIAGLRAV